MGLKNNRPEININEFLEELINEFNEKFKKQIHNNYHMELKLEIEIEKEIEIEDEKTGKKVKQIVNLWEPFDLYNLLTDKNHYLLINHSGMGKTTFLNFLSLELLNKIELYKLFPFNISCEQLNLPKNCSIKEFLDNRIEEFYNNSKTFLINDNRNNLLLMLDALDQANSSDDIAASLTLASKENNYQKAKIIISSRECCAFKISNDFRKIRLKLPENDQIIQYLGESSYHRLESIINNSGELITVPILLEMLKIIADKGDLSLINNRSSLYDEFTKILFNEAQSKSKIPMDEFKNFLEKIAFNDLTQGNILEVENSSKKQAMLDTGILFKFFEDNNEKLVFRHKSFQAYFAAKYIKNQLPSVLDTILSDFKYFYSDVWQEVIKFYIGSEKDKQKASELIRKIYNLSHKDPVKMTLLFAANCLCEMDIAIDINEEIIRSIFEEFKNKDYLRDKIIYHLSKFKNTEKCEMIIKYVNPFLEEKDWYIKGKAVEIIGRIGKPHHINLFLPLINDKHWYVRQKVAEAIGRAGKHEYIDLLIKLLNDQYAGEKAAEAIGKIITPETLHILIPLLEDTNIRGKAVIAIGNTGKSEYISLLLPLLKDEQAYVREKAAEALDKIIIPTHLDLLISILSDEEEHRDVRAKTAEIIGKIGKPKHIDMIAPLLSNDYSLIRKKVIETIGNIGSRHHVEILLPLLNDKYPFIRAKAAEAIGHIGKSEDVQSLIPLLDDEDWFLRATTVIAVGKIIKPEQIDILIPLLKDEEEFVKGKTAEAIGMIAQTEHINILMPLLKDEDWYIRAKIAEIIGKILPSDEINIFIPLLQDESFFVREKAAEALGNTGIIEYIDILIPLLNDKEDSVIKKVIKILGKIGMIEHIDLIRPLLNAENCDIRANAAEAIEHIYRRNSETIKLLV